MKIKRQSVPEHRLDCLKVDPDDKLESKDLFNGFFNTDLKTDGGKGKFCNVNGIITFNKHKYS